MAQAMVKFCVCLLLLLMVVVVVAEGAAKKPKKVKCKDKNYPNCYHKNLYCPASCLRTCVVDCASCKPVCTPPPPPPPSPPPPPPKSRRSPPPASHLTPPPPSTSTPYPPPPPSTSTTPLPPPPPAPISTTPLPPPPPAPISTTPLPSPPPPTPISTTPIPSPPPPASPQSSSSGPTRAKCKNKYYTHCYGLELNCPSTCPDQCEVDCVTCSPVCNCNKPGAVCQDPRFIGGDGITFYFHGKKDRDFCLVSDSNLHINAHFIGKHNQNMKRDFTWVQSLGILFDTHQLFIGAKKTTTWDNSVDQLALVFDGEPIFLPDEEGVKWQPEMSPEGVSVTRTQHTNVVEIEVEGNFKIKASVVPITEKESRVHNYDITAEDCFAHLDLSFKFYSLSGNVSGVLGQTYGSKYVSRAKMGVAMPILGGEKEFASSGLFTTDCAVARFSGRFPSDDDAYSLEKFEYANLNCASGIDGHGVVCKR